MERLLNALADFGFKDIGPKKDDFTKPGHMVQLGVSPVRIDLMTSVTGLDFAQAWANRVTGTYGAVPAFFISKTDLIQNKTATGRKQDLSDVEKLQKI